MTERSLREQAATMQYSSGDLHGVSVKPSVLLTLLDVADAAADPYLVILEYHPDGTPEANIVMRRAADRLRAALKVWRGET